MVRTIWVLNMSRNDVVCWLVIILGFIMFLYGANYYNASIGWVGLLLVAGGLLAEIILKVNEVVGKREIG